MNEDEIVKNKRNETIKEIDKIVDLLSSYYCDKFPIEIILPIATQIYMNEEKNYRHDVEQGNLGYMFGASIN